MSRENIILKEMFLPIRCIINASQNGFYSGKNFGKLEFFGAFLSKNRDFFAKKCDFPSKSSEFFVEKCTFFADKHVFFAKKKGNFAFLTPHLW